MGLSTKAVLLTLFYTAWSLCLDDGIPPEQRLYVQEGSSGTMPLGILECAWESGALLSMITKLLLEEVMGYHAEIGDQLGANGASPIYGLAGCLDFDAASMAEKKCGLNETRLHITVDGWIGSYSSAFEQMKFDMPLLAPLDLGSMGYSGEESIYLSKVPLAEAQSEGLALDFYKSYNTSHHDPKKYFGSLSDISIEEIYPCNETEFFNAQRMTDYVTFSGDSAGGQQRDDGTYVAKCQDGHWWRGPACRDNPADCIPAVTAGNGWKLQAIMQWIAAYGMPCAVGISNSWGTFTKHVREVKVLHYWWVPDSTFIDMEPAQVGFPRHSAIEWSRGDKKTSAIGSRVAKMVSKDLASKARVVQEFITGFNFELAEVQSVLFDLNKLKQTQPDEALYNVSCRWIRDNRERWNSWIPVQTACYAGYGVVDSLGKHLLNRTGAVSCNVCPDGTFSEEFTDNIGVSYRCIPCPIGTSQANVFSTFCLPCARGTFTDSLGSIKCSSCPQGFYQDKEGQSSCIPCNEQRTTRLLAATAKEECVCKAMSIESEGTCVACPTDGGLWCPIGSTVQKLHDVDGTSDQSQPYIEDGYFAFPAAPLSIYKCTESCPGGPPGACAGGAIGLTCRMCPAGQTSASGECEECSEQSFAFVGCLLLLFIGITLSYYAFSNMYVAKASPMFRATSVFDVAFVICQTLAVLQIAWSANSFGQEVQWTRIFLLDLDSLGISCTLQQAVSQYAAAALVWWALPGAIFLVFCILASTQYIPYLKNRKLKWEVVPTLNLYGKFMQIAFTTLANIGLMPFVCYQHPNGTHSVMRYSNVLCGSAEHVVMQILGCTVLLLATVFFGLCLLYTVLAPTWDSDSQKLGLANFLIRRFRPSTWWFGTVLLFRGPLLSLPTIIAADSQKQQLSLMFLVLMVSLCLQTWNKPWKSNSLNFCDTFCMGLLLSLIAVSMGCLDDECPGPIKGLWHAMLILLVVYLAGFLSLAAFGVAASKWLFGGRDLLSLGRPNFTQKLVLLGDVADVLQDNDIDLLLPSLEDLCTYDAKIVGESLDILMEVWDVPKRPYFAVSRRISAQKSPVELSMRTLTSKSTSETPFRGPDRMSPLNSDIASPLSSNDFEAKTNEPAANDKARGHPEPEDPESPTANDEGVAEVDSESDATKMVQMEC